ncbi:MAG TPA: pilus assembly protein TadG-related protein [Rhodopila sp.]
MRRVDARNECKARLPQHLLRAACPRIDRFARNEDGALSWFSLMLFFLMILMGGMAVDLMRFEYTRTALQQVTDRSALAAASLSQELDPVDVVDDYFEKAGMTKFLDGTTVDSGLNYREVAVNSSITQNPYFMPLLGIDHLGVVAAATAEERITNIEISLVLDVSRSMILYENGSSNPQKLRNVKNAAKAFVADVLANDSENRISISIVPYNGQVNLLPALYAKYNVTDKHNVTAVNCIDLPASVYTTAGLSTSLAMPATGYVDTFSEPRDGNGNVTASTVTNTYYASTNTSYGTPAELNRWCPPKSANYVRLPSNNVTTLQNNIEGLEAIGATSINAGIKWGLALLDPGSRTMFSSLASAGAIPANFSGRPFDYDDPETAKVIVLMTNGSNFAEQRLNNAAAPTVGYRTGLSPIYYSSSDGNFSIYHASRSGDKYWVPHRSEWSATAWKSGTQLTWPEVWTKVRASWVAWQLYARALGGSNSTTRLSQYKNTMDAFRSETDIDTMNSQFQSICTLAKNNNVVIYGIAFEAPSAGQDQIAKCAAQAGEQSNPKSSAYYFESNGSSIGTDFKTIASNISQLRLTQ